MNHLATLIGAVVGLLLLRQWFGAVAGAAIGWLIGSGVWRQLLGLRPDAQAPMLALFVLLGRLAKIDGRVSEEEVAMCERLMQRLALDRNARDAAIAAFNSGKREQFDLAPAYAELRQARRHAGLFLEVLVDMALADGELEPRERQLLGKYAWMLGVRDSALELLLSRRRARRPMSGSALVGDPYAVLGVTADADAAEVRRAFRKLLSQHHPDKLAARGAAPEMIKLAQERTQEILAAYEKIRSARGF